MVAAVWTAVWTAGNLLWLASDRLPRDGDEEGHVGAAELFRADLLGGDPLAFLRRLLVDDMGEYPSLYPALEGAWWWMTGAGDPGAPLVRGLGLLWVLLAAAAVGALARRVSPGAGLAAFVATTLLPLPVGLARHFMPEGLLVAAVALAVLAAWRAAESSAPAFETPARVGRWLVLGIALGAGLLVKQTFVLLAGPAVLAALWLAGPPRLWGLGVAALVATAVAGPWTLGHLDAQVAYLGASATGSDGPGLLSHLAFYPAALVSIVAGPPLAIAAAVGLAAPQRSGTGAARRLVLLAVAWLLGATLLLTLVPKKYPRLLAPAAPAIALLAGLGLVRGRHPVATGGALLGLGAAWLGLRSLTPGPQLPGALQQVVPGCPQQWLRAPVDDDLGLAAIAARVRAAPDGPVRFVGDPVVPCALQTTPPLVAHVSPYLRRVGLDRDLLRDDQPGPAVLRFTWSESCTDGGTQPIEIPRLGGCFRVEPGP